METILVCAGADRSDVAAEVGIEGDWVRLSPRRTGVAMITTGQKTTRGHLLTRPTGTPAGTSTHGRA